MGQIEKKLESPEPGMSSLDGEARVMRTVDDPSGKGKSGWWEPLGFSTCGLVKLESQEDMASDYSSSIPSPSSNTFHLLVPIDLIWPWSFLSGFPH